MKSGSSKNNNNNNENVVTEASKTLSDKNHTVTKERMKKGNRLGNQCRRTKSG
jgi:hypothetical protein